jgi:hypothetical protein
LVLVGEPIAAARKYLTADAATNAASDHESPRAKPVDEFQETVAETQLNGMLRRSIFCAAKMCCLCRIRRHFCQSWQAFVFAPQRRP